MDRLPAVVVTPRLLLRLWQRRDAPVLRAALDASVDHLRPYLAWVADEPQTTAQTADRIDSWVDDWRRGGDAVYGVFRHGTLVGGCGLHRRRGPGVVEIGYWVHVDHLRRGYATEAARGLTSAAFAVPDVDRVEIHHDKANDRSRAIPERLGYVLLGETPDDVSAPGEVGIDCAWSLSRARWEATAGGRPYTPPR